jgi:hypothetical protein
VEKHSPQKNLGDVLMPFLAALPAWIATLGSVAGAGISGVEALSQGGKDPTGQAQVAASKAAAVAPKPQTGPTEAQLAGAISPQSANVSEMTSGLANPDYIASIAQLLAGTSGTPNSQGTASSVVDKLFGLNGSNPSNSGKDFTNVGTTGTSTPSGPVSFSDFANQLVNA